MKTDKAEMPSSEPSPVSDAGLCAVLENSTWAKMEQQAEEFAATTSKKPPQSADGNGLEGDDCLTPQQH